jgi:hypothetical protein
MLLFLIRTISWKLEGWDGRGRGKKKVFSNVSRDLSCGSGIATGYCCDKEIWRACLRHTFHVKQLEIEKLLKKRDNLLQLLNPWIVVLQENFPSSLSPLVFILSSIKTAENFRRREYTVVCGIYC